MRKMFTITISVFCFIFAQDDFFEPGYSFSGYGELHLNKEINEDGYNTKNKLDFHRFVLFYGYNFSEKWSFKSEVELEHNMVGDSYAGYMELEQAYVNYYAGNWGFRVGVLLGDAGYINTIHEPPTFISVERPDYHSSVIPTTWFGNGFGFYGSRSGLDWTLNILEDFKGSGLVGKDGIRSARGKGSTSTIENWTKNIRVDYNGMLGINVGASMTMNDAPIFDTDGITKISSIGISLMEIHGKYNQDNIMATFEYGAISYTNQPDCGGTSGYYLDLGYDISDMVGWDGKLAPWFRYGNIQPDTDVVSTHYDVMRFGLSYWPIDQVVFKMDYGTKTYDATTNNKTQINMGVGYMF